MPAPHDKARLRVLASVALIALGVVFALVLRVPSHPVLDTGTGSSTVGRVTAQAAYVQEIIIPEELRLSSLEVLLATWGRPANTTHDQIRVFDSAGHVIQTTQLPPGSVADNAYTRVEFSHAVHVQAEERLFVALSSTDATLTNSITAWSSPSDQLGRLYVLRRTELDTRFSPTDLTTARLQPGSIALQLQGIGERGLVVEDFLRVTGLLVCLALAAGVWWWGSLKRWFTSAEAVLRVKDWRRGASIAWFYLVVALLWGSAMIVITPPFQVPDEPAHYFRAWSVANLQLVAEPGSLVTVPENVATLPDRLGSNVGGDWAANHYSVGQAASSLWERISADSRSQVTTAASYAPVGYVPQAIGMGIARVLGHSPLLGFYLGRLSNLIAAAVIVFFAIRVVPFGKPLLALVALVPMVVFETASLSPDALVLSGCILLLAMVLRATTLGVVPVRELIVMTCVSVILLNAKPGYAVVALVLFMLTPRQLGGARRYAAWIGATVAGAFGVAVAVALVAPEMPSGYMASIGMAGVDVGQQVSFVIRHPFEFAKVIYDTFDQQILGLDGSRLPLGQMAYGILGWLAIDLPTAGMWAMAAAGILFLGSREEVPTTPWQRFVMIATGAVLVATISLGLYTGWSRVAAPVVNGLQGRYFIAVIPLGLFGIYGLRPTRERTILMILVVAVGIAAATTVATLLRFYF